jgi:hypothetical protein
LTGSLQASQAAYQWIEKVQQNQCNVLIVVKLPIVGPIASARGLVQIIKHWKQLPEVLEPLEVSLLKARCRRRIHAKTSMRPNHMMRK